LKSLRQYVAKRVNMTDYPSHRQAGYDWGSGPTESFWATLTGSTGKEARMLRVEDCRIIRRAHRDGMSIRSVATKFRHSRRKVRKALSAPFPVDCGKIA
jgi:hypothetical protein